MAKKNANTNTKADATAERLKTQRAVYDFFVEHYTTQEAFESSQVGALTGWKKRTLETYWSKQFKPILVPAGPGKWRVSEGWRNYATWEKFQGLVTQVRGIGSSDYSLLLHDSVLIYEFFMPLTNETQLRGSLDGLFYRDSIINRLKGMELAKLQEQFPSENGEAEPDYFLRLSDWISTKFSGYSISTVNGRFRAEDICEMVEAAKMEKAGRRYLIDETTAIVRFIFPCGKPLVHSPPEATEPFDEPDAPEPDDEAKGEARRIRWFFKALFVRTIIQVVNAEAEIWMVESGMRSRLHIWKVAEETKAAAAEADNDERDLFEDSNPTS
jgi:hypothetical protein